MTNLIELEAAVYRAQKAREDRLNYWTEEISNSVSDAKVWETEGRADEDMPSYLEALNNARKELEEFWPEKVDTWR